MALRGRGPPRGRGGAAAVCLRPCPPSSRACSRSSWRRRSWRSRRSRGASPVPPRFPWSAAVALGAIVSPPDAVAATAIVLRLPVPRRVVAVLEGESLVNDASALVLYRTAVAAAVTGAFSWGESIVRFFIDAGVGTLV